jgi:soluble P-type ATPase
MIELNVPGRGTLKLNYLVCDVNGTLALDGKLLDGVARGFKTLRDRLEIHLLTANTHGGQAQIDHQLELTAHIIQPGDESAQKAAFIKGLGAAQVVAIGQGANDRDMLRAAAVGICVLSREGAAAETLLAADIVVPDILAAFELLEKPLRMIATLRK